MPVVEMLFQPTSWLMSAYMIAFWEWLPSITYPSTRPMIALR